MSWQRISGRGDRPIRTSSHQGSPLTIDLSTTRVTASEFIILPTGCLQDGHQDNPATERPSAAGDARALD
jgi:hypothetical protein